jgi:hypothetical protein
MKYAFFGLAALDLVCSSYTITRKNGAAARHALCCNIPCMTTVRRLRKYNNNIFLKKQAANNLKSRGDKKEMVVIYSRIKRWRTMEYFFSKVTIERL